MECILRGESVLKSLWKLILLFHLSQLAIICSAQTDSLKEDRHNFKLGYSQYQSNIWKGHERINYNNFKVEYNYKILKNIETGPYLGYSTFESVLFDLASTSIISEKNPMIFYGLNCNYIFTFKNPKWINIYITSKIGAFYAASKAQYYPHGNHFEYSLGIGTSLYLINGFGLFTEYTYGNYFFKDKDKFQVGISVVF